MSGPTAAVGQARAASGMPGPAPLAAAATIARVSVSLVTFNGLAWLPGCLASVRDQELAGVELLVIDNGSSDGTLAWLRENLPPAARASLIALPHNIGYAAAHNRNIRRARGEIVCLLNQDVALDRLFLAAACAAFEDEPLIGAVQGRIRRFDAPGRPSDVIDTTGLVMQRSRRVVSRLQGRADQPAARVAAPVWGVDGPAPVYRRAALLDAALEGGDGWEVLDEDFFAYKEDVDLAWRLRRLGWRAWYEPAALAWHGRGAGGEGATTLSEIARVNRALPRSVAIMSWRNQRLMQLKNERLADLASDLPYVVAREVLSLGHMLLTDPRRLAAVPQLLRRVPDALRKRRQINARAATRRQATPNRPGTAEPRTTVV